MKRLLVTLALGVIAYTATPSNMAQPHVYTQSKLAAQRGYAKKETPRPPLPPQPKPPIHVPTNP